MGIEGKIHCFFVTHSVTGADTLVTLVKAGGRDWQLWTTPVGGKRGSTRMVTGKRHFVMRQIRRLRG